MRIAAAVSPLPSLTHTLRILDHARMLQYRSADKLRDWLFQNFDQNGVQHNVILKKYYFSAENDKNLEWDLRAAQAKFDPKTGWHFYHAVRTMYHRTLHLPGNPEKIPELVIPTKEMPEQPEDIVNAVKPPEELPSWIIYNLLHDNASMVPTLRGMYETILYYRLAFPTVCFLCVFLGLPLAAKNERAGIFLELLERGGDVPQAEERLRTFGWYPGDPRLIFAFRT